MIVDHKIQLIQYQTILNLKQPNKHPYNVSTLLQQYPCLHRLNTQEHKQIHEAP
jgi:hypothetical protein